MKDELTTPTIREVAERAVADRTGKISPEDKEKLQNLLDSGHLDKTTSVINESIEKQIDKYITKEVKKAIKDGRLPPIKEDNFIKKAKQRAKRKANKKGGDTKGTGGHGVPGDKEKALQQVHGEDSDGQAGQGSRKGQGDEK